MTRLWLRVRARRLWSTVHYAETFALDRFLVWLNTLGLLMQVRLALFTLWPGRMSEAVFELPNLPQSPVFDSHQQWRIGPPRTCSATSNTSLVCGDGGGGGDDSEDTTSTTAHNRSSSDLLQEAAARFILKTKESHRLTQTSMNCIIEDMTSFNQIMLGELHYATSEALSAAGIHPQIICSLAPLFRDDGQFGHPFGGLETTYDRLSTSESTSISL